MFNASRSQGFYVGTLMQVPVRISGWFLALVLYYAYSLRNSPQIAIIWTVAVTLSILVHEFGHATLARYYKLRPAVLLHGFGGLCMHDRAERDRHDAIIVAAGPAFGLILGGITYLVWLAIGEFAPQWITNHSAYAYRAMIWINILWSFVNLIPLWPLDGGQLFRLALIQKMSPVQAERVTHIVGLLVAAGGAYYLYTLRYGMLLPLLAAYLAYMNYQQLQSGSVSGPIRPKSNFAKELLGKAEEALSREDWHEAARLCYQLRDLNSFSNKVLERTWAILTIATAYQDDYEQALRYARKAPDTEDVIRARAYCHMGLEEREAALALLDEHGVTPAANDPWLGTLVS